MTDEQKIAIEQIKAKFAEGIARLEALEFDHDDSVLFCEKSCLCLSFPTNELGVREPKATGIEWAQTFSSRDRQDRSTEGFKILSRDYRDGSGNRFIHFSAKLAQQKVLDQQRATLANLEHDLLKFVAEAA